MAIAAKRVFSKSIISNQVISGQYSKYSFHFISFIL